MISFAGFAQEAYHDNPLIPAGQCLNRPDEYKEALRESEVPVRYCRSMNQTGLTEVHDVTEHWQPQQEAEQSYVMGEAGMLCTLSKDSCSSMGLMEYRDRPSRLTFTISSWSLSRPPCHSTHPFIM